MTINFNNNNNNYNCNNNNNNNNNCSSLKFILGNFQISENSKKYYKTKI
nr:hypothetical protein [uncultured Cetobacterium sp.]